MSLDEQTVVARIERLTLGELRLWVREGWVRPAQGEAGPVFDELDVARLHLLCDLCKDMELPADVIPTVLILIDQLHRTRRDLRRLTEALDEQPVEVRQAIVASVGRKTNGDG
jgi:chaperone modulatory protein CbpM